MKNTQSGLILSRDYTRRESLQLLGMGVGLTAATTLMTPAWAASSSDVCALSPELTIGPYYVAKEKIRSNITEGKAGTPLLLRITVLDSMTCKPLKDAAVDIWHCDARGYYSGYTANNPDMDVTFGGGEGGPGGNRNGPPNGQLGGRPGQRPEGPPPGGGPGGPDDRRPQGAMGLPATDTLTFFRGVQYTNAKGVTEFTTIYPGWYYGRAIHIHLNVHSGSKAENDIVSGGHVCHTGQLAFPDELTDRVALLAPYANRKLIRTRNDNDTVFDAESASLGMLKLTPRSNKDLSMGFIGEIALTVDPAITPKPVPMRMPSSPPRAERS